MVYLILSYLRSESKGYVGIYGAYECEHTAVAICNDLNENEGDKNIAYTVIRLPVI